ncbi:hypothetical protein GQ54DRAFT_143959 [Martensiomyces pterosporus]|nr:hypothetical protein GQ54DRAFT_143959 [Martensiomyces pterosporus]
MMNPIVRRYVKHATLVERCFPAEKSGETTPNSNELSYLVYYAQSKPAKLTKVGAYLSKRISKDVQRRKRGDVAIGLYIYDALLSACGRDLNFFAKDVLGTLEDALAAGDCELSWAATRTFALYCQCHTGSTLAIDRDLRLVYSRLIKMFVSCAQTKIDGTVDSTRQVAVGMRAIHAAVESQATYATDCYYELPRIVKAVVSRIASAPELAPTEAGDTEQQILSIGQDAESLPDEELLGRWAWHCLETLVHKSHGQHSHVIVAEVFKYLDDGLQWQPIPLCVHVVTAVISQLQPQDQNMVIVETLAFLTDGTHSSQLYLDGSNMLSKMDTRSTANSTGRDKGTADARKNSRRRSCVIRILESLFCRPYILVGISVMEALNVLVTFLLESVADGRPLKPNDAMFESILSTANTCPHGHADAGSAGDAEILSDYYHLLAAVGGLASHQYYSEQLSDMVGYLVSQMGLGSPGDGSSAEHEMRNERNMWLLQSLYVVVINSKPEASDCIIETLRRNNEGGTSFTWLPTWSTELISAVYKKLDDALSRCHDSKGAAARSAAYSAVAAILCELLRSQRTDAAQCTLGVLRDHAELPAEKPCVSFLAVVWSEVGRLHASPELNSYVGAVVDEAKAANCWDASVDDACNSKTRIMAIAAKPASSAEAAGSSAAAVTEAASSLLTKLSYSSAAPLLGSELGPPYADSKPQDTVTAPSVDHVLRSTSSLRNKEAGAQKAVEQVKDIRARVSIDWEAQSKRDSLAVSQVNLDQLRAALRDGLVMRTGEQADSAERSVGSHESGSGQRHALEIDNAVQQSSAPSAGAGQLDAYGHPIPDEVRDLLNSIDDVTASSLVFGEDQEENRISSTISTPVISHVE